MKTARWGVLASAVCMLLVGHVANAWAASPSRVVLLAAEGETNSVAIELTARVRGELVASSVEVVVLSAAPATELRTAVETAATELSPAAVIAVRYLPPSSPEEPAGADVWISDRLTRTTLMQVAHVQVLEPEPAARLAVLVAEILKARLSLMWVKPAPRARPDTPRPEPAAAAESPQTHITAAKPHVTPIRVSLGGGAGFSHYFVSRSSSWYPVLQLGYEPPSSGWARPWVRLNATWTPQESRVQRAQGSLHSRETTLLLQGLLRLAPDSPVQPLLSVGVGAVGIQMRGEAEAPYEASRKNTWSLANSFGGGLWLQPNASAVWLLEAQVLAPWAPTHGRIDGVTVVSWSFPALFISASVLGRY